MTVLVLLPALASALALNWGFFVQHGAAGSLPPLTVRRPLRSLRLLFANRRWLAGFVTGLGGWALYIGALRLAPLSLVQAVSAGGLGILALLVWLAPGAARPARREQAAVVVAVTGLVLLGVTLTGQGRTAAAPSGRQVAVWLAALAIAAAAAAASTRVGVPAAAALGVCAGVLYATGDVATKATVASLGLLFVPVVLASHGLAFVSLQLAFQRGSALVTVGLATLLTNALPIAAGTVLFHERIPSGALGVVRLAAFALVVAGAALLGAGGETGLSSPSHCAGATTTVGFPREGAAMNVFRRLSNRGLVVLLAAVAGAAAVASALAVTAFGGGGATPPPEPLAQALHDAASAPAVDGMTARISFTNHLLGSDALGGLGGGGSPLLGASGRLWATNDGHLRLELQSDAGDAQIVTDGQKLTVYDGTSNTAYELTLPQHDSTASTTDIPPTLDEITSALASFGEYANLSGAVPDSVAGQPAYTVTATPKDSGGLLGGGEVSWDANTGVPLHVAIDARGSSLPVLDLSVTDISYGSVPSSDVDLSPPAGAKVVTVPMPSGSGSSSEPSAPPVTGLAAVAAAVPFTLVAPDTLDGLARSDVRLVGTGALITYGEGLGTIVVHEDATKPGESGPLDALPTVPVGGVTGHELLTTLGSLVAFDQGGVSFTVAGSVTQADAESAARALPS